jgi:HPt (histidine-containing phosphotransfer) domain-containing protein
VSDQPLDAAALDRLRQLNVPGEPDVLTEVLDLFCRDVPPRLSRLAAAADAGDMAAAERVAHSIKGSAANIGARALQEASRVVEDAARRGDIVGVQANVPAVHTELARVIGAIEEM